MSLAVNVERVIAVLLADGWHDAVQGSFFLDSYEFLVGEIDDRDFVVLHGGGRNGICATGFTFREATPARRNVTGPLTSVLAVREA